MSEMKTCDVPPTQLPGRDKVTLLTPSKSFIFKHVGVTHRSKRGKFQARIYKCNNEYNLGLYELAVDAAFAYDTANRLFHAKGNDRKQVKLEDTRFVFDWINMSDEECSRAIKEEKATFNFSSPSDFKQARSKELKIRFQAKDSNVSYQDAGVPTEADLVTKVRKEVLSMARMVAANTPDVPVAGKRSGDVHFDPESEVKKRKKSRKIHLPLERGQSPTLPRNLNLCRFPIQQGREFLRNYDQVPTETIIENNPFLSQSILQSANVQLRSREVAHVLPYDSNFNTLARAAHQQRIGDHVAPLNLAQSIASNEITLRALAVSGSVSSSLKPHSMTMAANRWLSNAPLSQSTYFASRATSNPFVSNTTSFDRVISSTSCGRSSSYLSLLRQIFGPSYHHFLDVNGASSELKLSFLNNVLRGQAMPSGSVAPIDTIREEEIAASLEFASVRCNTSSSHEADDSSP